MQVDPSPSRAEASVASLNRRQLLARRTFFPAAAQITGRLAVVRSSSVWRPGTDDQGTTVGGRAAQTSCRALTRATPSNAPSSPKAAETPAAPAGEPAAGPGGAGEDGPLSDGQPLAGGAGEDVLLTGADGQVHLLTGLRGTAGVDPGHDLLGVAAVQVLRDLPVQQGGVDVGVGAEFLHEVDPGPEPLPVGGELQRLGPEPEGDGGVRAGGRQR